jgi:methylated-DNA-[protein]-cysteine S-methyltransferase
MTSLIYTTTMDSPLGPICIAGTDQGLTRVDFQHGIRPVEPLPGWQENPGVLAEAVRQLQEYFQGVRQTFSLSLAPIGTPFQQQVWHALQLIPFGSTRTYQDLAQRIGKPKGARAVGSANGCNPIAIIIPCHRVVSSDGIGGYGSLGVEYKQRLLSLEGHPLNT